MMEKMKKCTGEGGDIAMIFQKPMSALNPTYKMVHRCRTLSAFTRGSAGKRLRNGLPRPS
jgi:ABC-type dipeptide/oligopeptide/nickel transport system ATPase component